MNRLIAIISLGVMLMGTFSSRAQDEESDCVLTLKDAERLYDQGKLEVIPKILESCLEHGFTKEEKIQAYRLLALTYLFDDNQGQAEESMVNMLKVDPEHKINPAIDPKEFIQLYESYRNDPIITYGINGGVNISRVRIEERRDIGDASATGGISSDNTSGLDYYSTKASFQGGINANYLIAKNLYVNAEIFYKLTSYDYRNIYRLNVFDNAVDTLSDFGSLNITENHSWVRIPVSFTYDFHIGEKFAPYIRLGGSVGLLVSSKATISREYSAESGIAPVTGPPENNRVSRNTWNYWLNGGLGVKYKVPMGNVFLDVRYNYGLRNMKFGSNYYNNSVMLYEYYHVDDDFIMDDIAFTIGYSRFFYKPKKKTKEPKEKDLRGYKRNKELQ